MGLLDSRGVSRDPRYLGVHLEGLDPFAYVAITPYGPPYPDVFG